MSACLLVLWGTASAPVFALDDAPGQNAGSAATTSSNVDADIEEIKKRAASLYYQPQGAVTANSGVTIGGAQSAPQASPSSQAQSETADAIKSNVYKLYGEKLNAPPAVMSQPLPQALPSPPSQTIGTPAVDTVAPIAAAAHAPDVAAASSPSPPAPAPAPPPSPPAPTTPVADSAAVVLISTAPAAATVASSAVQASAPVAATSVAPITSAAVAAPAAVVPVAAIPPATPAAKQQAVVTSTTAAPSNAAAKNNVTPAPVPAVSPKPVVVTSAPPVSNPPLAMDTQVATTSGEQSAEFLRGLAGSGGITLNVVDATTPADIQTPMHLDEAVAFALKNNFEVQAAGEKSKGAFWDKMGAYAEYMPTVQVAADTGPERSDPASINDALGNRVLDNTHNRKDESVTVTQPLIDLSIISDILSGTDKQEIADTDQRDVREGIAFDTASIYLSLLQSRIAIKLSDGYKSYLDDLAARMQARVSGGGAALADLDRIRGRSTAAEAARIEALGEYQTNLAEFKRLTKLMPAQLVIPVVLAPPIPGTMQEAMEKALKDNPSYISSLKKADLAEDDRNKSFAGLLPKLSGQYSDSYSFNAGGAAEGNPVDGVYPTQRTQAVMLVAQWELTGGTSITGGLSGIAKEHEMTLRALDIRARIEQGIQSGYAAINAAHQREAVLQKSVEANARVVKDFEEQYQQGGRSLFDMLDAYEQLYNSRLNLMRVTIAEAKAAYQVRRQMGELQQSILASGDH